MTTEIYRKKGKVVYTVNLMAVFNYIVQHLPQDKPAPIDITKFFPAKKIRGAIWKIFQRRFRQTGWIIRKIESDNKIQVLLIPDREDKVIRPNGPV